MDLTNLNILENPSILVDISGKILDISTSFSKFLSISNNSLTIFDLFDFNDDHSFNNLVEGRKYRCKNSDIEVKLSHKKQITNKIFKIVFLNPISDNLNFSYVSESLINSDIAMCITDEYLSVISCNERFRNYIQLEQGDKIDCCDLSEKNIKSAMEADNIVKSEGHIRLPDGKDIFFIFSVTLLGNYSEKVSYFFYFIDISHRKKIERELRESEQMMKAILTVSPLGIAYIKNRKIIWANEALYSMLEYEEDKRGIIKKMLHYPGENFSKSAARELLPLINEITYGQFETKLLKKDNSILECMVYTYIVDMNDPDKGRILTIMDVNDLKKAEHHIQKVNTKLRELTSYIENAIELERKEIAREIHDELGHVFTVLKIELSLLKDQLFENAESLEPLNGMLKLIDETIPKVRAISTRLRPSIIDHFGLEAAIEWQTDEFIKRTALKCKKNISKTGIKFDSEKSISVFRIFQETLTNIARHSGADMVSVFLGIANNNFILCTEDNGIGLNEKAVEKTMTLGITGIKERARGIGGKIEIIGKKGIGTKILLTVPKEMLEKSNA